MVTFIEIFWLAPVSRNILGYSLFCNCSQYGVSFNFQDVFEKRKLSEKWSSSTKNTKKATNFSLSVFAGR